MYFGTGSCSATAEVPWRRVRAPVLCAALLGACVGPDAFVPVSLRDQVDRELSFVQLKERPESFQGKLVVYGGMVLSAKRLKEATRLEVLQLPLDGSLEPVEPLTKSAGRFLAFQKQFLDPAILPPGTAVTVVGEVTGVTTLSLDEIEYDYPTLEIKALKVWPRPGPWYRVGAGYDFGPAYTLPYRGPWVLPVPKIPQQP